MKINNLFLSLMLILFSSLNLFATPPTAPAGYKWVKIENMSDEFNGTTLDRSKWDDFDPNWPEGRKPCKFEKKSISIAGGNLRLTGSKKSNPYNGWTHNGAMVRGINYKTYGYYETRMKAAKTFLSSTFWLFHRKSDDTGCDSRVTELDINENVGINTGGGSWINDNIWSMNTNTHSRGVPKGCNIPEGVVGPKYPYPGPDNLGYQKYHIVAAWWKSPTEIRYYLDNVYVGTVKPPADFDLKMSLRVVMESYDWNPPKEGQDGMNDTWANRTAYYDWIRSWELVPCSGADCRTECVPYSNAGVTCEQQTVNWSTGAIDISCKSNVDLSLTAAGTGAMENADYLNIYYKVDGGAQQTILENVNTYASQTLSVDGISGNTLEIIVNAYTSYKGEIFTVNNISVVGDISAPNNLLANWDFEAGDLTSWNTWGDGSVVANNQHGGSYAVTVNGAGAASQNVSVSPNTTYTLSCWGKVAALGQSVKLGVKNHDAAETAIALTSTSYSKQSLTFTTGANASTAEIYFYSSDATYQVWADDFELIQGTNSREVKHVIGSEPSLIVYPNPTAENSLSLNILEPAQIEIYTKTGLLIKSLTYDMESIDISDLKPGLYFIKAHTSGSKTNIVKFIKRN